MTYNDYPQRKDKENVNLPNGGVMQNAYQRLVNDVGAGALGNTTADFNNLVQEYKNEQVSGEAREIQAQQKALTPNGMQGADSKLYDDLTRAEEINAESSAVSNAINNVPDGSLTSLEQLKNSLVQLKKNGNQALSLDKATLGKLYDIITPALSRKRG